MLARLKPRDVIWGGVALIVATLPWLSLYYLLNRSDRDPVAGVVTSLLLTTLVAFWLGLGAWRRTRWGHTSPQPAAAQFLRLEIAGLVIGAVVFVIATVT